MSFQTLIVSMQKQQQHKFNFTLFLTKSCYVSLYGLMYKHMDAFMMHSFLECEYSSKLVLCSTNTEKNWLRVNFHSEITFKLLKQLQRNGK